MSYHTFRALFAAQAMLLLAIGFLKAGSSLAVRAISRNGLAGRLPGLTFAANEAASVNPALLVETVLAGPLREGVAVGSEPGRMRLLLPMARLTESREIIRVHSYLDSPADHPHVHDTPSTGPRHRHRRACYIDRLHPHCAGSQT